MLFLDALFTLYCTTKTNIYYKLHGDRNKTKIYSNYTINILKNINILYIYKNIYKKDMYKYIYILQIFINIKIIIELFNNNDISKIIYDI